MTVDVCIVAGRRPDLLRETLIDFNGNCFKHLPIANVFVNIDPIFGDDDDAQKCVDVVLEVFPSAIIFQPETPNFCGAVKRLWSSTTEKYIFHLEDDWRTLKTLDRQILQPFEIADVKQVSFHTVNQNWDIRRKGHFHHRKHIEILGIKFPSLKKTPLFSTSPSVIDGSFARASAHLMKTSLDPEKQFYSNTNAALQKSVSRYRKYIFSPDGLPVIEDTGRHWRDSRGIAKRIESGQSIWEKQGEIDP